MTAVLNPKVLFILVVFALISWLIVGPAMIQILDYPRTQHATTSHIQQRWNVDTIGAAMTGGGCGPVTVSVCEDTVIYTCKSPTDPKKLLGMVIGRWNRVIITAYASRASHWTNKTNKCTNDLNGLGG